jgi:hypothetical protein
MSKMFEREFRVGPVTQPRTEESSVIDEESVRHIALLVQTDTKLDVVNRRLDQFITELSRWGHFLEEAGGHPGSVASPRSRWGALVIACALFALGAVAGVGMAPWWDIRVLPIASSPAVMPVVAEPTVGAMADAPEPDTPEDRELASEPAPPAAAPPPVTPEPSEPAAASPEGIDVGF